MAGGSVNVTIILIGAIAILALMGGSAYTAYGLGQDNVRAEVAESVARARKEADAKRNAEAEKARKLAAGLQTALTKQKGLNRDLGDSLAKHIAAMPAPPAGCPEPRLTDGLLDDWNRANRATHHPAGRGLSVPGGTAAGADLPRLGGGNPESR
jgi:hypothetical protein